MTLYAAAPALPDILPSKRLRTGWTGFLLSNPTIAIGLGLLVCMLFLALAAPWLGTVDPTALEPIKRNREPSFEYWFGTDAFGRDIYSRVLYGARVSLTVGFSVALLASASGLLIGLVSGTIRRADSIIMRIMDGLMSIPPRFILLSTLRMASTSRSATRATCVPPKRELHSKAAALNPTENNTCTHIA